MSELDRSLDQLSAVLDQPALMLVILGIALVCSLAYALKPELFLKHKYLYEPIPDTSIRVARITGGVLSVLLAVAMVYYLFRLFTA